VLAFSVSAQALQPIPWWRGQIAESCSEMQLVKLSPGNTLNRLKRRTDSRRKRRSVSTQRNVRITLQAYNAQR